MRADSRHHVTGGHAIAGQTRRVQPHAHCKLRTEQLHITHTCGAADRIEHIGGNVVVDLLAGHAVVGRAEAQHHQEVACGFVDAQTLLLHLGGQQRHCRLQFVLHLHLRDVRAGALRKAQRDTATAIGSALRGDVVQAIDAIELLLDDLHHAVLHRLRRSTRIVGVHRHLRRCDVGVLHDRQGGHGYAAAQHQHQRQHPRKDGAVDKKARQHGFSPWLQRAAHRLPAYLAHPADHLAQAWSRQAQA